MSCTHLCSGLFARELALDEFGRRRHASHLLRQWWRRCRLHLLLRERSTNESILVGHVAQSTSSRGSCRRGSIISCCSPPSSRHVFFVFARAPNALSERERRNEKKRKNRVFFFLSSLLLSLLIFRFSFFVFFFFVSIFLFRDKALFLFFFRRLPPSFSPRFSSRWALELPRNFFFIMPAASVRMS